MSPDVLIQQLRDEKSWDLAAGQLVRLGGKHGARVAEALADALVTAAQDDRPAVARRILMVLHRLGLDAESAAPKLWTALADLPPGIVEVGLAVARRITRVGDQSAVQNRAWQRAIENRTAARVLLSSTLTDLNYRKKLDANLSVAELKESLAADWTSTTAVCQLLGRQGRVAESAVPALFEVMTTAARRQARQARPGADQRGTPRPSRWGEDPGLVAYSAAVAILAIDPASSEAAPAHGHLLLHEPIRALRLQSARELLLLGHHVERAVPMLVAFLQQPTDDTEILGIVLNCIAMAGPAARDAEGSVAALARSENAKIAARAEAVLRRIQAAPGTRRK